MWHTESLSLNTSKLKFVVLCKWYLKRGTYYNNGCLKPEKNNKNKKKLILT